MTSSPGKAQVFLDGVCQVCSWEARFVRRHDSERRIEFIDISAPDFSPAAWNVDPREVHKYLHIRNADGQTLKGLPAFILMWSMLPKYRWVARLVSQPGIFKLSEWGYAIFARLRPYLPKRKTSVLCEWT